MNRLIPKDILDGPNGSKTGWPSNEDHTLEQETMPRIRVDTELLKRIAKKLEMLSREFESLG
jgi:hypothetical protein